MRVASRIQWEMTSCRYIEIVGYTFVNHRTPFVFIGYGNSAWFSGREAAHPAREES